MYMGPTSDEAWNFNKFINSPIGRWKWLATSTLEVYEESEFPIFTGTHHFLQGELQQGWQNMHFTASDFLPQDVGQAHSASQHHIHGLLSC